MKMENITVEDCDYHQDLGAYGWCNLSENPCYVGMIDGNECDELNELRKEMEEENA